ncbi:MAG TPA: M48 family metallopeptidase [Thermoanaerobaculia bacterium]|nr:M48 family metallopeptidase [Thermoanaerobaculia bacterium]
MQIRPRTRTLAIPSTLLVVVLSLASFAGTQSTGEAALNLVSIDQEWAMRDELLAQVAQEKQLVNDRASLDYLNLVGRRLASQTPLGNRRWDFYIVRDSAVNAFNLPGGLIFVNSGLIAEAESLDQLAGVMAHEIGHGAARHGTQLMTRSYGYNLLASLALGRNAGQGKQIAAQLLGAGILTNYSRGAEREADRLGVNYTYRAGYDPQGLETFFGKLGNLRQRRPSKVQQFFSSHPLTEERVQIVDSEIARLPRKASLTHDTRSYQQFRARFR